MIETSSAASCRSRAEAWRRAGLSIGFVPTLGGLHDGHFALLGRARRECERVVASVYLNPTQFDSEEDLERYPADRSADREACRREGVDLLWLGRGDDLLPAGFQSWVEVTELSRGLCGAARPGHFRGVTTVVSQLLHVVGPHRAYFGLKDYQQARIVERMARDLRFDVEIRFVPTVREADGLALSSRNRRLAPEARAAAPALHAALEAVAEMISAGERSASVLGEELRRRLAGEPRLRLEYAELVDGRSLEPLRTDCIDEVPGGVLFAVAAYLSGVRLIDNHWHPPAPERECS